MQVRCPQCQETFQAKGNARRIKCPSCGTREEAPEAGFAAAWAAGKPRTQFQPLNPVSSSHGGSTSPSPAVIWTVVGIIAILAIGGFWYYSQQAGNSGNGGPNNAPGIACGTAVATMPLEDPTNPVVEIDTSAGCMAAEIYLKKAPITAKNFIDYVNEGFYRNLHVYRIEPGFVNQMGGERDGEAGGHPAIKNEAVASGLRNLRNTLAMARTSAPDSATTEFYINVVDNCSLDPRTISSCPERAVSAEGYAVFGKLVHGIDVSDKINTMTSSLPPGPELKSIRVVTGSGGTVTTTSTGTSSGTTNAACPTLWMPSPHPGAIQLDTITPGNWTVSSDTDTIYAWVHSTGAEAVPYTWSLTGPNGAALPTGWTATFAQPSGTLQPCGSGTASGVGPQNYPDYAATMVTLTIPASEPAGDVQLELRAASGVQPITVHVEGSRGTVTKLGDAIQTCYDLSKQSGERVQANKFPVTVGAQGAVAGYSFGTAGLKLGESQTLIVPPPFAYGWKNGGALTGQTLLWKVTYTDAPDSCPRFG